MSLERFPRRSGVATLVRRTRLTPRMLRVTLRHEAFAADWPIEQPGEIITLLFLEPDAAPGDVVLPTRGWVFPDDAPAQHWRNYTVRRHDPTTGEIDVDVVLHAPAGLAAERAAKAPVGAPVGFAGPRVDFRPREDARWLLLCGDETALPAIAAILEAPDTPHHTTAVVEVADPAEVDAIPAHLRSSITLVPRDGAPAATTNHLADALRQRPLPDAPGQVWGAAESRVARTLRDLLRDTRGLPRKHVSVKGYWLRDEDAGWVEEDA